MISAPRQSWRDAIDAKVSTLAWLRSEHGQRWMYLKCKLEGQEYSDNTRLLQQGLYSAVVPQLEGARPFFVSRDMCRMVEAAAETFKPEPIYPTDLLNLNGFLLYERPFTIPDRFDNPVTIKAVSWSPAMADTNLRPDRLLTREDEIIEWLEERHRQGVTDGLALTLYSEPDREDWKPGAVVPACEPLHITPWWWGMSFEGNEISEAGRATGAEWWWKIIQTTFRLMQQRITVRHTERPHRAQRREMQRLDIYGHDVTVVMLRREHAKHSGEPMGEMHYSHRFIVEGHWRNQHYSSLGPKEDPRAHRQIYIADYEKGPEGTPLIIKQRAYTWTR